MKFTHLTSLILGGGGLFYSGLKYFGTGKECQPTLDGTAKKLIVRIQFYYSYHLTSQLQKFHSKIAEFYQCSSFTIFGETVCIFPQNVAAFI